MTVHDVIVDCLDDDLIAVALSTLDAGRLVMDKERPDEPFLDDDGFLTVRVKDCSDPEGFARALQRHVLGLRVVDVIDRQAVQEPKDPVPGSYAAQRRAGLLGRQSSSPVDWML